MSLQILDWIQEVDLRTEKGHLLEFRDHGFLLAYLQDDHKRIVTRKCTQVGMSSTTLIKVLFYGCQEPLTSIFTLPTSPDAKNFVVAKFDPMIERSPGLRKMVDRVVFRDKPLFNTTVKRIGESYYFFKGSWAAHAAQSISADIMVIDELDFQKPEIRSMWEERTQGSSSKDIIYWLGYPSIPGFGIEELFEDSDQRMWYIECNECHVRQVLTFPESINFETQQYVCKACKKELTDDARRRGLWKPTKQGKEIHGYWINKLMAPWISAKQVIERFKNDTPKKFFNYTLGLPYVSRESDLTEQIIDGTMIDEVEYVAFKSSEDIHIVCGIDQGDVFHMLTCIVSPSFMCVISKDIISDEGELIKKLEFYNPEMIVMDALPNRHTAKKIVEKFRGRCYMGLERNWSEDGSSKGNDYIRVNRSSMEVGIERTESLDTMIELITGGVIKFRRSVPGMYTRKKDEPGVVDMIKNLVPDVQERFGKMRRVWKYVGPDHFAHALNFAIVSAKIINPMWQNIRLTRPLYRPQDTTKPAKSWYVQDFEDRIKELNGDETCVIPAVGERLQGTNSINPRIVY